MDVLGLVLDITVVWARVIVEVRACVTWTVTVDDAEADVAVGCTSEALWMIVDVRERVKWTVTTEGAALDVIGAAVARVEVAWLILRVVGARESEKVTLG